MKRFKKILLIILSVVIILFLWATWYNYEYAMEEAKEFQVNSPDFNRKLLIATQGSAFKDSITNGIVNHYKLDSIFIKVIDISSLTEIESQEYNAIVILHTWENWKPPLVVKQFIETNGQTNKMVVLTTSGQGSYTIKQVDALYAMENVDALTGESNLDEASVFIDTIIARVETVMRSEK